MRKYTLLFLFLCISLLTACNVNYKFPVRGKIVEETMEDGTGLVSFIVQTKDKGKVGVLLTEDSSVYVNAIGITEDTFWHKTFDDIVVSVETDSEKSQPMTTKEHEEIPAYPAKRVFIEEVRMPDMLPLKDGTEVEVWRTQNGVSYRFPDGIHLFEEWTPSKNPAYISGPGKEDFASLDQSAQDKISTFYEKQVIPYNLSEELEKAYAAYTKCKDKADFKTRGIECSVYPTASSDKVLYYATNVSTLLFHDNINTSRANIDAALEWSAAFDRETGAYIEPWNLFSCNKETAITVILDSANLSDAQKAEMQTAFDWKYVHFSDKYLYVSFPAGTLPSQKERYHIDIPYKQLKKDILHSWAIPKTKN